MAAGPTRWGIVSAGLISSDFVKAIQGLPTDEHRVVAVGARKLADAEAFAKKFNIPKAYGSYEEVAKDGDVDVVYIGCIHPRHLDVTTLVLNLGKPVLCEKPLGMNQAEVKRMTELAKEKGLFLMEALWTRFFPVYYRLREELKNKSVGKANFVSVSFGGNIQGLPRLSQKALGGGCVLDLGVYVIQLALLVFDHEEPERIVASGILNEEGVDWFDSITMYFKDKRVAQLNLHMESHVNCHALISGDQGKIEIPKFWCPEKIVTPDNKEHTFPVPVIEDANYASTSTGGFRYEAQAVRECLLKGKLEHELHPHSASLLIAKCMDEVLKQVGVSYE